MQVKYYLKEALWWVFERRINIEKSPWRLTSASGAVTFERDAWKRKPHQATTTSNSKAHDISRRGSLHRRTHTSWYCSSSITLQSTNSYSLNHYGHTSNAFALPSPPPCASRTSHPKPQNDTTSLKSKRKPPQKFS